MATQVGREAPNSDRESSQSSTPEATPEFKATKSCLVDLVEGINPQEVLPKLCQEDVISMLQFEEWSKRSSLERQSVNSELLINIMRVPKKVCLLCRTLLENPSTKDTIGKKLYDAIISNGRNKTLLNRELGIDLSSVTELSEADSTDDLQEACHHFLDNQDTGRDTLIRSLSKDLEEVPSPNTTAQPKKQSYQFRTKSVKVTKIPKDVTEGAIYGYLGLAGISGGVKKVNLMDGGVTQMNHAFIICESIDIAKHVESCLNSYGMSAKIVEKTSGEKPSSVTVKVLQLPKTWCDQQFRNVLRSTYDEVDIHLKEGQNETQYAWVNCPSTTVAETVVSKFRRRTFDGRIIQAKIHGQNPSIKCTLKVTNLAKGITEEKLKETLASAVIHCPLSELGNHLTLNIIPSDSSVNYAYINCNSPDEANRIKNMLNGVELGGFKVKVIEKIPKSAHGRSHSSPPSYTSQLTSKSIKLSNLKGFYEQKFKELARTFIGFKEAHFKPSSPPHGFIVFHECSFASQAFQILDNLGYHAKMA